MRDEGLFMSPVIQLLNVQDSHCVSASEMTAYIVSNGATHYSLLTLLYSAQRNITACTVVQAVVYVINVKKTTVYTHVNGDRCSQSRI